MEIRHLRPGYPPLHGPTGAREVASAVGRAPALSPLREPEPLPDLSVVVPMFNEEENVGPLVSEVCAALGDAHDYEIVLVDDGSNDATAESMRRARQQHGPRVRIMRHDRNHGQSAAILTGVRAARGALIATLDGDGQNDPADIPRFVAEFRARAPEGVIMLVGDRRERRDSWLRRESSRLANAVRDAFLHDGVADTGCGLKIFARAMFLALPSFDHMHRFLPALAQSAGGRIATLPANHRPRRAGRSKYGIGNRLWAGIVDLAGVMWLTRRRLTPGVGREDVE